MQSACFMARRSPGAELPPRKISGAVRSGATKGVFSFPFSML
jgi:hypothetical protein